MDPANGTIALRVLRAPAADPARRIGTLFLIAGGPGISGVRIAPALFPTLEDELPELVARFDFVFYERRGSNGALTCIDDGWVDDYRATAPDPTTAPDWTAVDDIWRRFADGCTAAMPSYPLPTLSSDTEARDLDRIRAAIDEDTISFFAISAGTLTAASYVSLFPARVRAGVLDSPVSPIGPSYLESSDRAESLEAALDAFFIACGGDATCVFHGGEGAAAVATAYDSLAAALRTPLDVGGRPVGAFDLAAAVQMLLLNSGGELAAIRGPLATMLADAATGDGAAVLTASDPWWWYRPAEGYDVGEWSIWLAVSLADYVCPAGLDVATAQASWATMTAAAPRMGPTAYSNALSCLHWPTPRAAAAMIAPAASPLLVVAGEHDLNVGGLAAAMPMVSALGPQASLIRWTGYGHELWWRSACVAATQSSFLVEPSTWSPPPGLLCAD